MIVRPQVVVGTSFQIAQMMGRLSAHRELPPLQKLSFCACTARPLREGEPWGRGRLQDVSLGSEGRGDPGRLSLRNEGPGDQTGFCWAGSH